MKKREEVSFLERPVRLTEEQLTDLLYFLGAEDVRNKNDNLTPACCFLHNNSSRTLGVRTEYPYPFNCFSCPPGQGRGPDIIALVQQAKKLPRNEAYSLIVQRYGINEAAGINFRPKVVLDKLAKPRFVLPESSMAAYPLDQENGIGYRAAQYYLGASKEQADSLGLGYMLRGHYLVFPIRHADGRLGGLVGRCLRQGVTKEQRWLNFDEGQFKKDQVLLGAHLPLADQPVIVVEGPKDYCKLRMLGWQNVRALLGKSASEFQTDLLLSYNKRLVIMLDEDAPGRAAAAALRRAVRRSGGRVLSYTFPESVKDETGKGDPGLLTPDTFQDLIGSFRLVAIPPRRRTLPR